jgi:peptidoglycan/xylan/chitin deacetylase (PgdA/CDA1 family)
MTRFHKILIVALLLCVVTFAFGQFILFGLTIFVFLTVFGLGVALPQLSLFGPFVCRGDDSRRRVALTFDDGPDARSTPVLLDFLREAKVYVAFFCVGDRVAANPGLAARIVSDGHLLENHSYAHSNFTNFFSVSQLKTELERTQAVMEKNSGATPKFFRPPMGLSNPRIFKAAKNLNLKVIGWSVRSFDTILSNPQKIVAQIARRLEPGAIILLHDGNIPAERLVTTVKMLLANLRELDYEVVRLDELLK